MRLSQQTKAQSLSTTLSTAKDRGPRTGVIEGVFPSDLELIIGGGCRAQAVVRGSRTLVGGLIESGMRRFVWKIAVAGSNYLYRF